MAPPDVFECDPRNFVLTDEMVESYNDRGYILIKGFFDEEEMAQMRKTVEECGQFRKHVYGVSDGQGAESRLSLWCHPGNDVTGMIVRCEKVVNSVEKLLGGEVYHYHTKLMTKEPRVGGKHIWHQDYGLFIPIDPCRKINGCLEVLEGSHKCGRIEHNLVAGQQGCDPERLAQIRNVCPHKYVEMDPGKSIISRN